MARLSKLTDVVSLHLNGAAAGAGSLGAATYGALALLAGGLALTGATILWYVQTHRPLQESPVVGRLPSLSTAARPAAPPFLFAIYGVERPVGVAIGPGDGRIYVAESDGQHLVRVFDRSGQEVASLAPPDTTPAHRRPTRVALDPRGKVYVSDLVRSVVDVYGPDGSYQGVLRPLGLESDDWRPLALAFDPAGGLYVTEITPGKHRVLVLDADGRVKAQFGREGKGPGELSFPGGLAVGGSGLVYVSDSNNGRVQVLDPRAGFTRGFRSQQGFGLPRGMSIAGGRLYVVDTTGDNVSVFALEAAPRFLYAFGDEGRADGRFLFPEDVALDSTGRVYVTDRENNRLQIFGRS